MIDTAIPEGGLAAQSILRPEPARVDGIRSTASAAILDLSMADGSPLRHCAGQFVQVSVFGYGEVPISVCSSPVRSEAFQICVRPVGRVSKAISELEAGDWVGIRGPYGQGFPVSRMHGKDLLLLAGGIGLAPLRSLMEQARHERDRFHRLILIYGARNPGLLLFRDDLEAWSRDAGVELMVTVDEADEHWRGRVGVITGPLREMDLDASSTVAAVVGPPVMYRFAAMEMFAKGMRAENIYFSLERHFKCGIGKCGHCQLNDLYVCRHGPVFVLTDLLQRTEAIEAWSPEKDRK